MDGDTIEVVSAAGTIERVRYIGVDTPESVDPDEPVQCGGKRAAAVNERLVGGRAVTLRFDAERRDIYGRLLAYVTVGDRAETVNAALVRRGWARTLEIEPNTSRAGRLARLELKAARAGLGIWGGCDPAGR